MGGPLYEVEHKVSRHAQDLAVWLRTMGVGLPSTVAEIEDPARRVEATVLFTSPVASTVRRRSLLAKTGHTLVRPASGQGTPEKPTQQM